MIKSIIIYEWHHDPNEAGCEPGGLWGLRLAYPYIKKPFERGDIIDLNQGNHHIGDYKVELFGKFDTDDTLLAVYVRRV